MRRHRFLEHHLRVCNAYPSTRPLDVFHGFKTKLTGDTPMAYKSCRDFKMPLRIGDKIRFVLDDHPAGVFVVQNIPPESSVMLLVIKRHDTVSTAVAFQSHVFAKHDKPQIAIINTFQGHEQPSIHMAHVSLLATAVPEQPRQLRPNSLESVAQGMYDVNLTKATGATLQRRELVALDGESYVILVSGFEDESGEKIPQDLVVYPHSDADKLPKPNSAQALSWVFSAAVAVFAHVMGSSL